MVLGVKRMKGQWVIRMGSDWGQSVLYTVENPSELPFKPFVQTASKVGTKLYFKNII